MTANRRIAVQFFLQKVVAVKAKDQLQAKSVAMVKQLLKVRDRSLMGE